MGPTQPIPLRTERNADETDRDWGARIATPILTLALQALEERVLLWVVTLAAGAIWIYAVIRPDLLRIGAAALFSATVLWPFLWRRR